MHDIEKIRQLVEMMVTNDLVELTVRDGDHEIKLRRPNAEIMMQSAGSPMAPVSMISSRGAGSGSEPAENNGEAPPSRTFEIRSPMVGTFYAAPDPDSQPYVKPGDQVGPNTVVCVLEAMKVFSEIKAEVSGFIERIMAKNGESVEYGQPLFLVRPD